MRFLSLLALGFSFLPVHANGADISVATTAGGTNIVSVRGAFEFGDDKKFVDAILPLNQAVVVLESPGGNLSAGLGIGRAIRLKSFGTMVPSGAMCTSACALAWLGGVPRAMPPDAMIGFHAAHDQNQNVVSSGNALVGAYLTHLGLRDSAIIFITTASPVGMAWLTYDDAARYGIEVRRIEGVGGAAGNPPATPTYRSPPPQQTPPSAPPEDIQVTARRFLQNHYNIFNRDVHTFADYMDRVYSDTVEYFGRPLPRRRLLEENIRFINRWPSRIYSVRASDTTISCERGSNLCTIFAVVDWNVRSDERRVRSIGTTNVTMTLDFSGQRVRIIRESGVVTHRNVIRD